MSGNRTAFVFCTALPFFSVGCLSNSYLVEHDELQRLASLQPADRWESIRALQQIGGDDYPPDSEPLVPPPVEPDHDVFVGMIVVDSHHHGAPPPRSPPGHVAQPRIASSGGSGSPSFGKGLGTGKKGNGDSVTAAAVAAAVVVGAASTLALMGTEGARYDGWLTVDPNERLHLKYADGEVRAVPLWALSPVDAAAADNAMLYEGQDGRFARLQRAPLNRAGFTIGTALHMSGIPELSGGVATGLGGYLHLGGNIANIVTLGLSATADTGLNARQMVLMTTVVPEIHVFPIRYAGVYAGYGWSFRNTLVDGHTRGDSGGLFRAGIIGELPLTTRLGLQAHLGVADYLLRGSARIVPEGQLGFCVY